MKTGRVFLCAVLCFALFSLCGCRDSVELRDRLIVETIGFDYAEGNFFVTLQYFSYDGGGGETGIQTSAANTGTVTRGAPTIAQATRAIFLSSGKDVFYGKAAMILIGSSITGEAFKAVVDYLSNDYKGLVNDVVMAADGNCDELLAAEVKGGMYSSEVLLNIAKTADELGFCPLIRLNDLQNMLYGRANSAFLPILRMSESAKDSAESKAESSGGGGKAEAKDFTVSGMRVYKGFDLIGELSEPETSALMLMTGKGRGALEMINSEKHGVIAVRFENYSSTLRFRRELSDSHPVFEVKITAKGTLAEVGDKEFTDRLTENPMTDVQKLLREQIERQIEEFFALTFKRCNVDAVGLMDLIYNGDPNYSHEKTDRFPDLMMSNAELITSVSVTVENYAAHTR